MYFPREYLLSASCLPTSVHAGQQAISLALARAVAPQGPLWKDILDNLGWYEVVMLVHLKV